MKLFHTMILALLLLTAAGNAQAAGPQGGSIRVLCTVFPQYDWVRQILGGKADDVDLSLLLSSRGDLHSYQPSVGDVVKISTCDLFIYVGGESDEWVKDALEGASNPDRVVINLLDILGAEAKVEEIIEGMEDEMEDEEAHGSEEPYDEHVWLSLKNAKTFCSAITGVLSSLDAGNAPLYQANAAAYIEKLSALDAEYQAAVDAAPVKTLLFGDRFPFRYLTEDYDLTYHAAFPGCSAETEASFATVVFLANQLDESDLKTVITLEGSDQSIARTVIGSTTEKNQQILVLDSMQSVTASDAQKGTTYLSIMENNLNVLKEALR